MERKNTVVMFTNILQAAVANGWEDAEIAKLLLCLLQSTQKYILDGNEIHEIIKRSKTICPEVLNILLEESILDAHDTLPWILQLPFSDVVEMLSKCFEEETFTVLAEYENNILVLLYIYSILFIF